MVAKQEILKGFDGFLNDAHGLFKRKTFSLTYLRKEATTAYNISLSAVLLSDKELNEQLARHRTSMRLGKKGEVLLHATGFICEAVFRSITIRPYIEQIMGSFLVQGNYAIQMQTGEGKTITAAVAAVLVGWKGCPCHIVTSND